MSKKKRQQKEVTKKSSYKNPMDSFWGKLLVWLLIIGMLGGVVVGAIFAIIEAVK